MKKIKEGPNIMTGKLQDILDQSLGDTTHYRNYFETCEDCATWMLCQELVGRGYMRRGRTLPGGLVYFHVTEAGEKLAFRFADGCTGIENIREESEAEISRR